MTPAAGSSAQKGSAGPRGVTPGGRSSSPTESTTTRRAERGLSVLELLFALATSGTVGALAMAATTAAIDEMRTAVAARYIAGRIGSARIDDAGPATPVQCSLRRTTIRHPWRPSDMDEARVSEGTP